ncbi:hypothetical protein PWT90_03317 [Aphanocladium album]|nr:hypothetical protein PWT90_03317 [Aphanocladium album]
MAPPARARSLRAGLLLGLSAFARHAAALDLSFCADINTATGSTNTSNLQSNGLCHDFCSGSVFSITYQENCWCADDIPAKSNMLAMSDCNFPCLGYPYENCGGKGQDVYGYVSLGPQPSGTKTVGGGGSSATSKPTKSSSNVVQTVTVGGTTIIVTPTATGDPSKDNKPVPTGSSGLGGGAIAGIVIGAVAGIALIGLLIWFLLRRRKQNEDDEFRDDPSVRGSSRGRIGSHQNDLSIAGSAASPGSAGNRSSMLQVDPRMDPFKQGLYMRNGSAESINTLRDDHDYSRRIQAPKVLRATNPDPQS